jgi:hypothetical protein
VKSFFWLRSEISGKDDPIPPRKIIEGEHLISQRCEAAFSEYLLPPIPRSHCLVVIAAVGGLAGFSSGNRTAEESSFG